MVDETQRAISILQQRQGEAVSMKSAEELLSDFHNKANLAILEVKQTAIEEIRYLRTPDKELNLSNMKDEICWNCGRAATETCSGCGQAKYCGAFCQHKDWNDHSKICRQSPNNSEKKVKNIYFN